MNEQASFCGDNIIVFPRHPRNMARRNRVRVPDDSFMADYERLVRAFVRIEDPKTRALIIELLKAGGAPLRWTHTGR
jgi:hypothetical protein